MKTQTIFLGAVALTIAGLLAACEQPKESKEIAEDKNEEKFENKADEKDAQFVVETANAMHNLIALSDVAIEKNSPSATAAQSVKPDFQTLLNEVEAYAAAHVISVPAEATEKSTERARKLLDEKPSEFDAKWCRQIKDENKELIGKLESYGEKTKDANLKTWLNSALPAARAVQDKLSDFENKTSSN